jgi:hypothetical protein
VDEAPTAKAAQLCWGQCYNLSLKLFHWSAIDYFLLCKSKRVNTLQIQMCELSFNWICRVILKYLANHAWVMLISGCCIHLGLACMWAGCCTGTFHYQIVYLFLWNKALFFLITPNSYSIYDLSSLHTEMLSNYYTESVGWWCVGLFMYFFT